MLKPDPATMERLTEAYDKMLARAQNLMDETQKAAGPVVEQALDDARTTAIELGELTKEESKKVSEYLRRDLHDAAHRMDEGRKEFGDWFRFDVKVVEDQVLELFAKAADQTAIQLREMAEYAREVGIYKTGEITGPGSLLCQRCGKEMHFKKTGHIPPCPSCHDTSFKRPPNYPA